MFISNQGLQILIEFLNLNYDENKDLIMLAVDSVLVIYDDQTNLQIPAEDLSVILTRMGLLENLVQVLPKLVSNTENSTNGAEQASAEKFLEKAFDVIQLLLNGNQEVKVRFCSEQVLNKNIMLIVQNSINDPGHLTPVIVKRFIKFMQLVTQSPATYKVSLLNLTIYL